MEYSAFRPRSPHESGHVPSDEPFIVCGCSDASLCPFSCLLQLFLLSQMSPVTNVSEKAVAAVTVLFLQAHCPASSIHLPYV